MASKQIASKLLDVALPLVPKHGFTTETLSIASTRLPPPFKPDEPFSRSTINALFPSAPSRPSARSLTREELVASASSPTRTAIDRLGPARAVLDRWLEQGRLEMSDHARKHKRGKEAMREGLRERIRYNEAALAHLPDGLSLLNAAGPTSVLSSFGLPLLDRIPHMSGYAEHTAAIAHDLAQAAGDESQGTSWYRTRAQLATVYAMAELRLIAPEVSQLAPSERIEGSLRYIDKLLESTDGFGRRIDDVGLFAQWIFRSWAGIARSWGM